MVILKIKVRIELIASKASTGNLTKGTRSKAETPLISIPLGKHLEFCPHFKYNSYELRTGFRLTCFCSSESP